MSVPVSPVETAPSTHCVCVCARACVYAGVHALQQGLEAARDQRLQDIKSNEVLLQEAERELQSVHAR